MRETEIAVSIDTKTPRPNTRANPLISDVPNQKRMTAVIIDEMLESRIEGHALLKPSLMASRALRETWPTPACPVFRPRSSSLVRSKIKMFASTAIPMERIKAAMPAAVSVTGISLNNAKIATT